jgi:predicted metal-dependent hydrolase
MRRDIATEHIQKLLDEGKSYGQISRELGISRAAIHKRLRKVTPVTSDEKHPLNYNERMEILREGGTIQDSEEVTPKPEISEVTPVTSPTPEEHLQKLFQQTIEEFFPEHIGDGWKLICFPNEEEWRKKLEEKFPGQDNSKIEATSNYETGVVSIPSSKNLPDQMLQAFMIHECCHLVIKEREKSGHGMEFCNLLVKCMEKVVDPFIHVCLELQLFSIVVKGLLPLLKAKQPKPPKPKQPKPKEQELLRFPKRYRSRHLEDLIKKRG